MRRRIYYARRKAGRLNPWEPGERVAPPVPGVARAEGEAIAALSSMYSKKTDLSRWRFSSVSQMDREPKCSPAISTKRSRSLLRLRAPRRLARAVSPTHSSPSNLVDEASAASDERSDSRRRSAQDLPHGRRRGARPARRRPDHSSRRIRRDHGRLGLGQIDVYEYCGLPGSPDDRKIFP